MIQHYLDFHLGSPFCPWRHERLEVTSPVIASAHLARLGLPDYPVTRGLFREPSEAMSAQPRTIATGGGTLAPVLMGGLRITRAVAP